MKAKYASHRNQYPQSFWIFHVPIFHARLRLLPMSVCIVLIPIWFALEHYLTNYTYFCESLTVEGHKRNYGGFRSDIPVDKNFVLCILHIM